MRSSVSAERLSATGAARESGSRDGFFGRFGGRYVAEALWSPLSQLAQAFREARHDSSFQRELGRLQQDYVGRPTPLFHAANAERELGAARIYIKLEGLAHTGAHKINNVIGQALLARRMRKRRIIAETGAGQHGVAVAAACAKFGLACTVYMGELDIRRQMPNVVRMRLFGAQVRTVSSGSCTLKDAVNEALRDWASSYDNSHYLLGSALGPAPYPDIVRHFQSIIGTELVSQLAARDITPTMLIACVGGGSNAIGFFSPYLQHTMPRLIGVEAGGRGDGIGDHAARMNDRGRLAIVQGYKSLFLTDEEGQVQSTHSVSAGLDYPGIGPQLADLGERGRIEFRRATDREALEGLRFFARHEGLLFALESAHAAAAAIELAPTLTAGQTIIVNMSGQGDKDLFIVAAAENSQDWRRFLESEVARL